MFKVNIRIKRAEYDAVMYFLPQLLSCAPKLLSFVLNLCSFLNTDIFINRF